MTWSASRNEKFSAKAFYSFLTPRGVEAFPVKVGSNEICFFALEAP